MYWFNSGNQTWPVKEDLYKKMTDVVNERDAAVAKLKCAAYGLDWNVYRYWWEKRREDEAWHEEHRRRLDDIARRNRLIKATIADNRKYVHETTSSDEGKLGEMGRAQKERAAVDDSRGD